MNIQELFIILDNGNKLEIELSPDYGERNYVHTPGGFGGKCIKVIRGNTYETMQHKVFIINKHPKIEMKSIKDWKLTIIKR